MSGYPKLAAAAATSSSVASGTKSGTGTPRSAKNAFCAHLSWMTAIVAGSGCTSTPAATSSSSAPTSTCSISTVTTSHPAANARTASLSRNEPTTCSAATEAGAPSVGSNTRTLIPRGAAARASIRPSWPPPRTPTVEPRGKPPAVIWSACAAVSSSAAAAVAAVTERPRLERRGRTPLARGAHEVVLVRAILCEFPSFRSQYL
mmetsp:Transcript_2880/g.10460  ORF Transcript_2880/g.10460 Transcript_2880/m.10460 type:complete len:204 (+) Transcript_2880:1412-2023(+)